MPLEPASSGKASTRPLRQHTGRLQEQDRALRHRLAQLTNMLEVVSADADELVQEGLQRPSLPYAAPMSSQPPPSHNVDADGQVGGRVIQEPRPDFEVAEGGNRGYIVGTPPPARQDRKPTRQMV